MQEKMKTLSKAHPHLMVCGGGTGGHFFSGVAVAEIFLNLYPEGRVTFVGTRLGIEARTTLSDSRMNVVFIHARGLKGKSLLNKLKGVLSLFRGILESCLLLTKHRPQIVAGVGGYASAPTLVAAIFLRWLFRWKVFVLEQNSSAGLVNQILSQGPLAAYAGFKIKGFQLVDLPLREGFLSQIQNRRSFEWPPKVILIMGGSQGARGLNDRWLEMLPDLKKRLPEVEFIHQSGFEDRERVEKAYKELGLKASVIAFTNELPELLQRADLVVARAGAMTVFEVMKFARPVVFVPFPKAADDHQTKNALAVQKAEWVIAESQFMWSRLSPLLDQAPSVLKRRQEETVVEWKDILTLS